MLILSLVVAFFGFFERKTTPDIFEDLVVDSNPSDDWFSESWAETQDESAPTSEETIIVDEPTTIIDVSESISEPELPTSEEELMTSEPELMTSEPEVPTSEPEMPTSEEELVTSEPEVATSEEELPTSEPELATSEPEMPTSEEELPTSEEEIPGPPTSEEEPPTSEPEAPTTEEEIPTSDPEEVVPTSEEPTEPPGPPVQEVPDNGDVTIGSSIKVGEDASQSSVLHLNGNANFHLADAAVSDVVIEIGAVDAKLTIEDLPAAEWSAELRSSGSNFEVELKQGNVVPFDIVTIGNPKFTVTAQVQQVTVNSVNCASMRAHVSSTMTTLEIEKLTLGGSLTITRAASKMLSNSVQLETRELTVGTGIQGSATNPRVVGTLRVPDGATFTAVGGADYSNADIVITTLSDRTTPVLVFSDFDCSTLAAPRSITLLPVDQIQEIVLASGVNLNADQWAKALNNEYTCTIKTEGGVNILTASRAKSDPTNKKLIGIIAAIAVIVVVVLILVIMVIVFLVKRQADRHARMQEEDSLAETDVDEVVEFRDPEKQTDKAADQEAFLNVSQDINPWAVDRIDPAIMFDDDSDI